MLRCFTHTMDASFVRNKAVPEFVKTAELAIGAAAERIPDTGFALVVMEKGASQRLLPIHNKAHTWLSAQYLDQYWPGMPKIAASIAARSVVGAAEAFDVQVPETLKKLASMAPEKQSRYYAPSRFDIPVGYPEFDGATKQASFNLNGSLMPIRNMPELDAAERWFDRNHTKLASAEKYRLALFIGSQRNNLTAGNEKNANYMYKSAEVQSLCSLDTPNPSLRKSLLKRASMCSKKDIAEAYVHMALNEKIAAAGGPVALIDQIESLDLASGLYRGYGTWIETPISTVMTRTKFAEDAPEVADKEIEVANRMVDLGDAGGPPITIREVRRSCQDGRLKQLLGESTAKVLSEHPEKVLETMSDDVRNVVVSELRRSSAAR